MKKLFIIMPIVLAVVLILILIWAYSLKSKVSNLDRQLSLVNSEQLKIDPKIEELLMSFKSAFESGDYNSVKALFTEDGVMTTAQNIHYAIYNRAYGTLSEKVDEKEFYRLAIIHAGEEMTILGDPLVIGDNTIAFSWQWGDGWVSGSTILHLRDGKIVIAIFNPSQAAIPPGGLE